MDFYYYVNYFELLEERLYNVKKFVAFENENKDVFSIEFASIINDCCGLINGFCFELCKQENPAKDEFNMTDYKKYIFNNFQKEEFVFCDKFILQPWEKLINNDIDKKTSTPLWWKVYNEIKHSGKPYFQKATLRNAISCMTGMFSLLVMYDFKQFGSTMCNWHGLFKDAGNAGKGTSWEC